jgi:hypothetical protein
MRLNGKVLSAQRELIRLVVGLMFGIAQASLVFSCRPMEVVTSKPNIQPSNTIEVGWAAKPETNFGFVLEYGICFTHKLDTFQGKFSQDRVIEPSITIPLNLTSEQLEIIYQKMREVNLVRYPEVYAIPTRPDEVVGKVTPAWHYNLRVVNGMSDTSVSWVDEIVEPIAPEADNLRELLKMIVQMISENPDVMELPELKFGCA